MEERYKSLAAMKAEPWIEHFRKTVGDTTLWSNRPRPIVIKRGKEGDSGGNKNNENLPLTVVSPIEQSNDMAQAQVQTQARTQGELTTKSDKNSGRERGGSVHQRNKLTAQRLKRGRQSLTGTTSKKIPKINDVFTRHVKR